MNPKAWLKRFWQRAYGRKAAEVGLRPISGQMAIVRDGDELAIRLITDEGGAFKVWAEVTP